ncbi:efflux RND transporter periplasmic adaptor subunit [Tellurirhabdus rosea]|uniref:efflux RND transporter periplasmic adaptor subunit n=1 Tax=Tellurirhabdus rosea TaxID=2674997 RepID=UPI0022566941|nr:efflux RND transporter periplasmic adaptor subunit [Tellurirhabdus rosea]
MKTIFHQLVLIAGTVGILTACSSEEQQKPDAATDASVLAPAQWKQLSVASARLEPVQQQIQLTGTVTFNQDKMVKVFPLVGGHIETVKAELGDYVRKGQVLAVIQSGDIADLDQQAVSARSQLAVAQKNLQVTQDMASSGLASQRDLTSAQQQLQAAKGEVNRVAERKRILGGGNGSQYVVKAPMDGFIVEKKAAPGMELRPDDPDNLFTISNLDQIWVMADVYESDLANVHLGDPVTITTLAYPDKPITGRIDKIFNVLDPDSKTEKVRITLSNPGYQLKPDMFANVTVSYPGREQSVAVPSNALVFDNSRNYLVVVGPNKQLQVREVTIERSVGDKTYIRSGLRPGETIVSQNQLLVYNGLKD